MKFNVKVVDFRFAVPSPDQNAPKQENTAFVRASKGTALGRRVYSVLCGEQVFAVGEKLRVSHKIDKGAEKITLVARGTA